MGRVASACDFAEHWCVAPLARGVSHGGGPGSVADSACRGGRPRSFWWRACRFGQPHVPGVHGVDLAATGSEFVRRLRCVRRRCCHKAFDLLAGPAPCVELVHAHAGLPDTGATIVCSAPMPAMASAHGSPRVGHGGGARRCCCPGKSGASWWRGRSVVSRPSGVAADRRCRMSRSEISWARCH